MVNRNLQRELDNAEPENAVDDAFVSLDEPSYRYCYPPPEVSQVVFGRVSRVVGDQFLIDIGEKTWGTVARSEWQEGETPPQVGDLVEVLFESVDEASGVITLSYRKAKRIRAWEQFTTQHKEGDIVSGVVTREVRGGVLVDIGITAFLPTNHIDVRKPADVSAYIGKTVSCLILTIDETRRNVILSRRMILFSPLPNRAEQRRVFFDAIQVGDLRNGVVKNIADFGAFVDLGCVDGLLHINDMGRRCSRNPHDIVKIDQEIQVVVLRVDRAREKIALGLQPLHTIEFAVSWISSTVKDLAETIDRGHAFDRLPILADALEEAGCDNADILNHCRQPGEHVRGCWVVDALLGKE